MPARHDRTDDDATRADLLLARRGQAYFSRVLAGVTDRELAGASRLAGWSRAHVAAHVGLNARALTNLVQWAATGVETPMYASTEQRDVDIAFAATLPPHAIRHLDAHAAVHLSVEWRDLAPGAWHHLVRTAQGRSVPASATPFMRAREVWVHAIDLGAGGRFDDLPTEVLERLLADVTRTWERRGVTDVAVRVDDGRLRGARTSDGVLEVSGALAAAVQWATGRGSADLVGAEPPRWV